MLRRLTRFLRRHALLLLTVAGLALSLYTLSHVPILCPSLPPLAARIQSATVHVQAGDSQGSGVCVRARGGAVWVWTCQHVIGDAKTATVTTVSGDSCGAMVIRCDAAEDLAVLLPDRQDLQVGGLRFAGDNPPPVGTPVWFAGCPGCLAGIGTVSSGIVSFIGRTEWGLDCDQCSTPLLPGASGGAICRQSDGRVLGLATGARSECTAIYTPARRIRAWAVSHGVTHALGE
jgi:S1-C subfamily serine protease